MKSLSAIGVAAFLLIAGGTAMAQTAVQIEPARRAEIKQYMVQEKVKPVVMKEKIAVGTAIPSSQELSDFPAKWGDIGTKYKYVYMACCRFRGHREKVFYEAGGV